MGSGEWGAGSGEWGVGSGEHRAGEWGAGSGEWRMCACALYLHLPCVYTACALRAHCVDTACTLRVHCACRRAAWRRRGGSPSCKRGCSRRPTCATSCRRSGGSNTRPTLHDHAHGMHMPCTCHAHAVHVPCTCHARVQGVCSILLPVHSLYAYGMCNVHACAV